MVGATLLSSWERGCVLLMMGGACPLPHHAAVTVFARRYEEGALNYWTVRVALLE